MIELIILRGTSNRALAAGYTSGEHKGILPYTVEWMRLAGPSSSRILL
jgi:hypothetical protein